METPTEIHSSAHGAPLAGRAACGRDRGHTTTPIPPRAPMSVFVWAMIGVALRSHSVLVPDRFCGGIIGALVAAVAGTLVSGYLLPSPGVPTDNPPRDHVAVANSGTDHRPIWNLSIRRSPQAPPGSPTVAPDAPVRDPTRWSARRPSSRRPTAKNQARTTLRRLLWLTDGCCARQKNACHTHCDDAVNIARILSAPEAVHR